MNARTYKSALLTLSLALMGGAAQAQIGANFTAGAHLLGATDQPGVVAGANWNNVVGSGLNIVGTTVSNLLDASGATTTAYLKVNSGYGYDGTPPPTTANLATRTLYSGCLYGLGDGTSNAQFSVTLGNIPYASYDVYVYASHDTTSPTSSVLSTTIGAQTFYYASGGAANPSATTLLQTTSTDALSPTRGPAQYQLFSDVTGSSFTLTSKGSAYNVIANDLFGIQIVPTAATPEPGSVALLVGMTSVGAGVFRKRRKTKNMTSRFSA